MQLADLDFAAACTAAEGWATQTRAEFEGYLTHDARGCLIAQVAGQPAGICVATWYGAAGCLGELIVTPRMRGRGIGRQLVEHALEYLRSRGALSVFLDGVLAAVPLYERIGFQKVCRSLRFRRAGRSEPSGESRQILPRSDRCVRPMQSRDLDRVCEMDAPAFGAGRRFLIERRLCVYPDLCWVAESGGELEGFILGRRGNGLAALGPWLVRPGAEQPGDLVASAAAQVAPLDVSLGVLETNTQAIELVRSLGFVETQDPPWRMVWGKPSQLGSSPQLFAIGSAAQG